MRLTVTPPVPALTALPNRSSNCTVIVPPAPAMSVCGGVVNSSSAAAAATTVSCCVPEVTPPAAAVSVGVPATVSLYVKLAVLLPAEMEMLVTCVAPLTNCPLLEVVVRLTNVPPAPAFAALPYVSSNCTVIVPEATPAVSVWAVVVKTILLVAAAETVSCCVAEVRVPDAAVIVGVPASVSL